MVEQRLPFLFEGAYQEVIDTPSHSGVGPVRSLRPEKCPACYHPLLAATGIFPYNGGNTDGKGVYCYMLNENLQAIRKAKGLSQQELAVQLHVVRQTISKWEKGVSLR